MKPLIDTDPTEIGGHRLLARLGAGGMGQVYLGLGRDDRLVAVKVVLEGLDSPDIHARFRREVRTVERVDSPFAARLVGAGLDVSPVWLATEYVPGPTLKQAVEQSGPLPAETCMRLLGALAQGLAELHAQGVQHRDLKPGNVILAPDGPRFIDFGIARGDGQTQITRTGGLVGTPGFLAPEVIQEAAPVPASDVFSLAGTIAYAATGRPPFGGGPLQAVLHRTLSGMIDLDGVPVELADLVEMCAEKDPAARITPDRLVRLTAGPPVEEDPWYQRLARSTPPAPRSLAEAIAAGLAPQRTPATIPTPSNSRSPRPVFVGLGGLAVVLAGALVVNLLTGGEGRTSGGPGSASSTPKTVKGGVPATVNIRLPGNPDYFYWDPAKKSCQEAQAPVDDPPRDFRVEAPAKAKSRGSVKIEFMIERAGPPPASYYLAAGVWPAGLGSSVPLGQLSKPFLIPDDTWRKTLEYPADFRYMNGPAWKLSPAPGHWIVVVYHVRPDGSAAYIDCTGFVVE
ncbi:serine/threonine-protein kinase [Actinomadura sp. 3N508]|uniref:serine/threonine-protein kinase n=1 Tax=Actinomadura sp. 3N508 TaxID=3375153 RepID=UPI0037AD8E92